MDWEPHARRLAADTIHPSSRWYEPVATTPRHLFVPRWWERAEGGRIVRDGAADADRWLRTAYSDETLVTRMGTVHADHAEPGAFVPSGTWPTSSSTLPTLVVTMYRHAMITDDSTVLVTCGSGYGTALACHRLGAEQVTSVDIDGYLVAAATDRLAAAGLHPHTAVCDITKQLPGTYDRIVSTVSVRPVPPSWLEALRPGGRLVTTISGTGLILVADKKGDGTATGCIAATGASFMSARHGEDHDDAVLAPAEVWETAQYAEGESVTTGRYPLTYVPDTWDLRSTLELLAPGIDHRQTEDEEGRRTIYMLHADGSWARATAAGRRDSPTVHQGGPRRLWDELDRIRTWLVIDGYLPVSGARVRVDPDGAIHLNRSGWSATIPA
ncbi:50S ribosomal protein L11 methyltransferase [Streptomyces melanogenes]|uniref:50S ribosomal protein L11 methyltransferase n=1 Tax=Streptomyces melanogenes TaxID=67326 RepID=UPI00167ECC73|nr:methyltransferase domain-containing protein [Streptomyces melanogenes]GGP80072.1 protein-L-isoaspartate O-methyltransferase [Streptomyces melanogenes]